MCDGGAEIAMMSLKTYEQLSPKPELRTTIETVRGLYGPEHKPMGECTVQIKIPELSVVMSYDVIVDDIDEDFLMDATLMHYAGVQLNYDRQELTRKNKVAKGVARISSARKARRLVLERDWIVQPESRQLVPGKAVGVDRRVPHNWLVEPSRLMAQRQSVLIARTLCQQTQTAEGNSAS